MKVNFSDTEEVTYDALPANTYIVNITDGEQKESKSSSFDYINWEFTVTENADEKLNGRKAWGITTLNPEKLSSLKSLLSAAGFDADGEIDFEIEDVIGKKIKIVTNQREYNGEQQTNVRRYKPLGDNSSDATAGSVLP